MKWAIRLIVVVAVAAAAFVGYTRYQRQLAEAPLEWSGTIEARSIQIASKVGGRVASVLVQEGEMVDAGRPLVTLEPGDLPTQRDQAVGVLEQAQASLERVASKTLSNARHAEIDAARARVQSARVQQEKGKIDRDRMQMLLGKNAVTQADFENADIAFRSGTAEVQVQAALLNQLLSGTSNDVKSAEAAVRVAQARIDQLDVMLGELSLRAPAAAYVETLDLRPGDVLAPNAPAVELLEPDQLYVRIFVPETQLGRVHLGQEVPVYVDTFVNRPFKGVVEYIAKRGEFSPRNLQTADERADQVFATRVRLDEGRTELRAGMAAVIRVKR
jgi:multidrug resistance efflux pump